MVDIQSAWTMHMKMDVRYHGMHGKMIDKKKSYAFELYG